MFKKLLILIFFIFTGGALHAQSAEDVYNQYLDFNLARFQDEQDKVKQLGEAIIPNADKLPEKARVNFYFAIGKIYEDSHQTDKALPFYEKVATAVPDYYVVHRALGYIYSDKAKVIAAKMNALTDEAQKKTLAADYKSMAVAALPHLEKAQACDPDDDTLALIKSLYQSLDDKKRVRTLDDRLKKLHSNCIDILTDQ